MIVYIAGPMTGIPENNYPAFNAAEDALTAAGHTVLNPARNGTIVGSNAWQQYMRLSIAQVLQSEAVAFLPGWLSSRGALLERRIATALGLRLGGVADFLEQGQRPTPASRVLDALGSEWVTLTLADTLREDAAANIEPEAAS